MGRRKGSRNKKTLERMGLDKYKIDHQNDGKKQLNNPQNDGDNKPKRHRRTKLEMEQARKQAETSKPKDKNIDRSHLFNSGSLRADEVSDKMIKQAKEQGKGNWEQDFRNDYEKGQRIYYVEVNDLCHTKELLELYVGTVYSKVMVCWEDKGASYSIGIDDIDKIFLTEKEAKQCYQRVRI